MTFTGQVILVLCGLFLTHFNIVLANVKEKQSVTPLISSYGFNFY